MEKYNTNQLSKADSISELFAQVTSAERRATKCGCHNCHNEFNRAVAKFRLEASKHVGADGQRAINDYARKRLDFLFQQ